MNPLVEHKLDLLRRFIDAELRAWPQVQGVVVVGSVAQGTCRLDSDIDAYVFFHPAVNEALMPAEFLYIFSTGEYHDIFIDETVVAPGGDFIHLDAKRVEMSVLEREDRLSEGERAQLAAGILAWDREGELEPKLAAYVTYPESLRRERLLEHLGWSGYLLAESRTLKWIDRCGQLTAQDQLTTATEHLIRALFAYHRHWEPYRNLWLEAVFRLAWQPEELQSTLEEALVSRALTPKDLRRRLHELHGLFESITTRLVQDGFLPAADPDFWIFRETHPQLGYSHNMTKWQEKHMLLVNDRPGGSEPLDVSSDIQITSHRRHLMLHRDSRVCHINRALIGLLILVSFLPGCSPRGKTQPVELSVKIDSPASGMEVSVGQEVAIQSTATGPSTVSWIELWVDGELVDTTQAPTPLQPMFSAVQHWKAAAPQEHLIEVRAYDEKGTASPPANIVLRVSGEEAQQMPTATPQESSVIPTATRLPTVPVLTATAMVLVCENGSEFVEDVTVPDNTEFTPGTMFEKTWRLRNNGTCPWQAGYELAFVEGEQMAGPDRTSIPKTEPGAEADISVTLLAPDGPGTYRGNWRLRAPDGELFGAKLYTQIVVVAPTVTPELTATIGLTATPAVTVTATPGVTVTATPTTAG